MKSSKFLDEIINNSLRQMGATKIITNATTINIVTFEFSEGMNVIYEYGYIEKNEEGQSEIYLQRHKPYSADMVTFANGQSMIRYLSNETALFRNTYGGENSGGYIEAEEKISTVKTKLDDLLLWYNVSSEDVSKLIEAVNGVERIVTEIIEKEEKNRKTRSK